MIRAQEDLSVRSQNSLDGANQNDGGLLSDDDDDDELEYSTLGVEYDVFDEQVSDNIDWAEDANWNQTHYDFTRCLYPDPVARLQQLAVQADRQEHHASPINRNSLNPRQLKFIQLIETLLQYGPSDSSTDGGGGLSRCCVLRGRGGTGKSYVMDYLRQNLGQGEVLATATTGKAAILINGSTVYNRRTGLALPITKGKKLCWKQLNGREKQKLQQTHKNVRILFIDEYTMLQQAYLEIINKRLQEIMGNNRLFGGIVVVLVGDTAQLPPVGGDPLYGRKRQGCLPSQHLYFEHFKSVIELTEIRRVDPTDPDSQWFESYLGRLANAEVTHADYTKVCELCSKHSMGVEEWNARGFSDPNTTNLFPTNVDVDNY